MTPVPDQAAARRAMFADLQASLPATMHVEADGPYLVTHPPDLHSWLGVDMPTMPQMALCRCGRSASKPLCDGTHADIGVADGKDPNRVPDRLDTYVGLPCPLLLAEVLAHVLGHHPVVAAEVSVQPGGRP